ncbi:hypothetical protein M9H77_07088 [Catharanthus roseus]|uniref:Uncharacterized protein n=1 Tax=Catharanthus roseus TaxID=4058 RepID=A0ACC0BUB7_CATRO|nr:hypothetical protein M9H77_07088 [Catharanthus roseus]
MAIPNAKSPLVLGLDMASMLCPPVCVIIPPKLDSVQVQTSHESVRRQLATVKGCAPYSAKRSKRVSLNIRNRLRLQCRIRSSSISESINALRIHASKNQYNMSRGLHSRSNQIGAHAISIKYQGQWALDARALALLPSTLFIV